MREMKDSGIEWIGEIPKERNVIRNKYLLLFEKGKLPKETNTEKRGQPYIGASDLNSTDECGIYTLDEDLPNTEYDDSLILWDGAHAGLCGTHRAGKVSSTVMRVRPNTNIYKPFLFWYLKGFESYFFERVNGTTIPHMSRKYIEEIGIIDWAYQEQCKIADYLDVKCSKIDEVIRKQEKVIEKLKEYRLSVITEAVTKGLNPNVEMKDSGIEWIGEMPVQWEIHKIQWDYSVMLGKMLDTKRIIGEQLHPYIKNADVQWFHINSENLDEMDFSDDEFERYSVQAGDLMICEGGEIGKCAIVPSDFPKNIFYQKALHRVRSREGISGNVCFLNYVMFSMAKSDCLNTSPEKATIAHLPGEDLKQLRIPSPPMKEQEIIANVLEKNVRKINIVIEKKYSLIDFLYRYKKSLIYEVVTGKKDICSMEKIK